MCEWSKINQVFFSVFMFLLYYIKYRERAREKERGRERIGKLVKHIKRLKEPLDARDFKYLNIEINSENIKKLKN